VRFDTLTRVLYSTDASNHQVEPLAWCSLAMMKPAGNLEIAPGRGSGDRTGRRDRTCGRGDRLRPDPGYLSIPGPQSRIDSEARSVTVEPGAVLSSVNRPWLAMDG